MTHPAPDVGRREIADCPRCGREVTSVIAVDHATWARPCGHQVVVTVWPDHVELEAS